VEFRRFVRELERETTWHFDKEISLLLLDATYDPLTKSAHLDYSKVIDLDVLRLMNDGVIMSPVELIEGLIIRGTTGSRSITQYSNRSGLRAIFDGLISGNADSIVAGALTAWRIGRHFAVRDLRRRNAD
jgi:hypothetical protein